MTSLAQYKRRIGSTSSLKKIFRAQELIAASQIRRAKQVSEASAPYSQAIYEALTLALASLDDLRHPLITPRSVSRTGVLVLSSDRGMAGSFNSALLKTAENLIVDLQSQSKSAQLYVGGRRGWSYFNFRQIAMAKSWIGQSEHPSYDLAVEIGQTMIKAMNLDADNDFAIDEVYVVYTNFKNLVFQTPQVRKLLPLEPGRTLESDLSIGESTGLVETPAKDSPAKSSSSFRSMYIFEPPIQQVLDKLIERYLFTQLNHFLLESTASETASRQRAMHTANDNAEDLLDDLIRKMNQARQANITNELNEIAGAKRGENVV
jgi:F-type H+-transporting ATPase subunit gamma